MRIFWFLFQLYFDIRPFVGCDTLNESICMPHFRLNILISLIHQYIDSKYNFSLCAQFIISFCISSSVIAFVLFHSSLIYQSISNNSNYANLLILQCNAASASVV